MVELDAHPGHSPVDTDWFEFFGPDYFTISHFDQSLLGVKFECHPGSAGQGLAAAQKNAALADIAGKCVQRDIFIW